jgi:UDP-2,3-diacylglucosamine pyrophosphatase LpxH
MKDKTFIQENLGRDKIPGRPMRLNVKTLKENKENYVEVLFFGDLHLGHPKCKLEKARSMLDWALKNKAYVIFMGDLIEAGLRDSIGDSVYFQEINPQGQMEGIIELLRPLAEEGLILGIHDGNHECRILQRTSINITKLICRILNVTYLGYAGWNLFKVGKQNYTLYTMHGASGARFKHTKLKAVADTAAWLDADVIAMGHVHSISAEPIIKQAVSLRNKVVEDRKCYIVLTGSYVGWEGSYAQNKNLPPTKIGSPKGKFRSDYKDVHFTL